MSGTKLTTSIEATRSRTPCGKHDKQKKKKNNNNQNKNKNKNKGEENVHDEVSTFPVVVLGLEAGLEPNKAKVWMTPTSLNLMHPMT
jgi:hypothetical protein